ncbi:MAG TPA: UDP-N-acetylmuramate--L-alanine ligase [Lachnospiraceae bacterium]|nr:UDP-N-acetylmuramate--L-alanine ligase [Lachnospiraceae bacterium]
MYQIDFKHPAHIYFVGIGGISMSGLAEILREEGFQVSGSDKQHSPLTQFLENKGVSIFYGQRKDNITPDIDCAVFTSAIHPDNPEYIAVKEQNIPFLSRAELLGQIMKNYRTPIAISGTHGKTTTTSMISEILLSAKLDPTLSIGGILKSINGNIHVGKSEYFVAEACEYTNSFLSFFPRIGIILNIEEDHLDFFKDLADIRNSFHRFAELLPKDGALIINGDIENVTELTKDLCCKVITVGHTSSSDYYYTDVTYNNMGCPSFTLHGPSDQTQRLSLNVPGEHNVYNAMTAFAVSDILEISRTIAANALLVFHGTDRRFEYKGTIGGVTIIDDYAHHPTEITATLKAASNYPHKTIWCVFQPHTYTRTITFMKEFAEALSLADKVVLADIYASRETDTLGISSRDLQKKVQSLGKDCYYFPSFDEIESFLLQNCINGDLLITMGAGDVVKVGENLIGY